MTAHRTEVRVDVEILIVIGARQVGIEGELEMFFPVERRAGLREFVVAITRGGYSERYVG